MRKKIFKSQDFWAIITFVFLVVFYFRKFFFQGLVPFPGNLLVSFFAPWSSEKWPGFPFGVPRLDLLGLDTVRMIYPWKTLSLFMIKNGQWPLWNPYNFSGSPHLANFQTAIFYPLNIFYFFFSQINAWTMITILGTLLGGIFIYLFLRQLKIGTLGSLVSALTFAFSAIAAAWLPWNTYYQSLLWLPLLFFLVEKLKEKFRSFWVILIILVLSTSFFAGHPQAFLYVFLATSFYLLFRLTTFPFFKRLGIFTLITIFVLGLTAIQWLPTAEFYQHSLRKTISSDFSFERTLLPWQNLITALAPDFFGNPATENFFGKINYTESLFYFGGVALFLGLFALLFKREKIISFFGLLGLFFLLFSLPIFGKIFVIFKIPFFSTSVATRGLFLLNFSFAVLAGFGLDLWLKDKSRNLFKKVLLVAAILGVFYLGAWLWAFGNHLLVTQRNLLLPSFVFLAVIGILGLGSLKKDWAKILVIPLILLSVLDLFYLANKITPFSPRIFVFPSHPVLTFLQKNGGVNRFYGGETAYIETNFATQYRLFSPEGYDALYLRRYGELLWAAGNQGKIPQSFPRSVANLPKEDNIFRKRLMDLLGVKFIVDKNDLYKSDWEPEYNKFPQSDFELIWQEKKWKIYENKKALPRFFLAGDYILEKNPQKIINLIFDPTFPLRDKIILEEDFGASFTLPGKSEGVINLISYKENQVKLRVRNEVSQLLFLSDNYYPGWKATIDGKETRIYRADYTFRAVAIPVGNHEIEFSYQPKSSLWGAAISF